jgi:polyketide biosynthesis enoyl-CoA hydratase PksI
MKQITYLTNNIAYIKIATDEQPYFNANIINDYIDIVAELNSNPEIKVAIFTGTEKYFSMGAQREILLASVEQGKLSTYVPKLVNLLAAINVPMIAAMEGHAVGGGLAIGLWCDIVIMAKESLYGVNFMALGFTPGMGATILLEEAFGRLLAQEMLYTGKLMKGHELKAAGVPFAHTILPRKDVLKSAHEIAFEIAQNPGDALVLLKNNLTASRMKKYQNYLQQEQAMHKQILSSQTTLSTIRENYLPKQNHLIK